jgi:hypothetical protein
LPNATEEHIGKSVVPCEVNLSPSQTAECDASAPWLQSSLVMAAPKTTQKVDYLESRATTIRSRKANDQEGLICSDYAVSSYANADGLSQLYISNLDSMSRSAKNHQNAAAKHTIDSHILQTPVEVPKECSPRQDCNVDELSHSSNSSVMGEVTNRVMPRNSSRSISEESNSSPVLEANTKGTVESELAHPLAGVLESISSRFIDQSSSAARASTNTAPESRAELPADKRYTMRQLARIALVAANGARLTTSQIIIWIAHTFPCLRVGEGTWETSVQAALSAFAEFHGQKIIGSHGNKKLYEFATKEIRAQYETEYSEFCTTLKSIHSQASSQMGTTEDGTIQMSIKGTPILHTSMSTDHLPAILITTEQLRSKTEAKHSNHDTTFMPFERSTLCKTLSTLDSDLGIKRETSFLAAYGSNQRHTVKTMSEAEKAEKITEIKARPSRKQYFGSDYRLAHKRWHGLDDIHDERIGAWKPQVASEQNQPDANEDVDMNGETVRTLREVFNLPNNMIPMNDGQTELAFRDGTLVMVQDFTR